MDRTGADAPAATTLPLEDETRFGAAACLALPRRFALGFSISGGLQNLTTMHLNSMTPAPNFALYGQSLQFVSITAGAAYRPIDEVSIGVGASVLVNSRLGVNAYVPVLQQNPNGTFRDIAFNVSYEMTPRAAPYLGVLVEAGERARIGASFRGELAHDLSMPVSITAVFLGFNLPVPIQLDATMWYSPRTISIGAEVDATDRLLLTADASWYDYRALENSAYPYLRITEIPDTVVSALPLLGVPVSDAPGFRSAFAIRAGAEATFLDGRLALRAGYGLRTSALPKPGARNTTLLDGMVHMISVGGGYAFGRGWTDETETPDGDDDGIRYEGEEDESERNFRLDGFARLAVMPTQSDTVKDVRYGGTIFDFGGTFTFGWR